jgi:hypothetical protein
MLGFRTVPYNGSKVVGAIWKPDTRHKVAMVELTTERRWNERLMCPYKMNRLYPEVPP